MSESPMPSRKRDSDVFRVSRGTGTSIWTLSGQICLPGHVLPGYQAVAVESPNRFGEDGFDWNDRSGPG